MCDSISHVHFIASPDHDIIIFGSKQRF
jgi:hypothetical protein